MLEHFNYYEYQGNPQEENVIFSYKGPLNDALLSNFSKNLRSRMKLSSENKSVGKKVFAIFMELAQNVVFYSREADSFDGSDKVGTIVVLQSEDHYKVMTGNLIVKESIPKLLERAEHINTLNRDELREYKRERRSAPQEEESKGAGIGLIHVAITSGQELEVDIKELDDERSFYILAANISREPAK